MEYHLRMTTRTTFNDREKTRVNFQTHLLPARDRHDAERMADVLPSNTERWREGLIVCDRTFDVVAVLRCHDTNGARKIILSIDDLEMIANEYTTPRAVAAE